jgi:hypothetical protein
MKLARRASSVQACETSRQVLATTSRGPQWPHQQIPSLSPYPQVDCLQEPMPTVSAYRGVYAPAQQPPPVAPHRGVYFPAQQPPTVSAHRGFSPAQGDFVAVQHGRPANGHSAV